ncbi:MAG TPA: sugar ABC transporter permease [Mycobacteriales bacterium]|jgi:multiple sugar transport system permease protein|nr:sugar ABC transporter permease [Mycobacteriales bacterium]
MAISAPVAQKTTPARRRRVSRFGLRRNVEGWLFIAPVILGVVIFQLFPILVSMYASLTNWNGINPPKFIGLDNFRTLFGGDDLFVTTVKNTIYFTVGTIPLTIILAFFLAVLCNQKVRGVAIFRTAYFAPYVTNIVAIGFVWFYFFDPSHGVVNGLLSQIGIHGPAWLSDSNWVIPALILVSVWQGVGYPMVILLAGLQGISAEIQEAATVDGAGAIRRTWSIVLPLLTPQLFFLLITQFISSFQVFGLIYVMTQGGPGHDSSVYIYYLYQNAFAYGKMGYASAMAWLMFVVIAAITFVQWKLQKRWVFYG